MSYMIYLSLNGKNKVSYLRGVQLPIQQETDIKMDTKIKRTSQAGQLELFYEVKITEATISDLSCINKFS